MKNIPKLYEAGSVKRWHTVRTIQTQTLADHSWGVIMILLVITNPSQTLIRAAATHDLSEVITGDVPAPTKWAHPRLDDALQTVERGYNESHLIDYNLTSEDAKYLKWADMLELVMFANSEIRLGNSHMTPIRDRGLDFLRIFGHPNSGAAALFEQIEPQGNVYVEV